MAKSHSSKGEKGKKSRKRDRSVSEGNSDDGDEERSKNRKKHEKIVKKKISEDDYFIKVSEFSIWLNQCRKKRFEDLSSKDSHKLFVKFCRNWNEGKLEEMYYKGNFPSDVLQKATKTKHNWNLKINEREKKALENASKASFTEAKEMDKIELNAENSMSSNFQKPSVPPRKSYNCALDNVAPKETGREALLDKKRTIAGRIHASSKMKEYNQDGLDLSEKDTFGGGGDFYDLLRKKKENQFSKKEVLNEKLKAAALKEREKREAFIAQMGLDSSKKLTIQPRKDE
mmetsp:Transcript_13177/g.18534  ORF Transcript_13177/g.18534 Transcript_13177/m.18534 type:complete len:286 (+) Transcript_13177:20-877(+)